MPARFKSKVRKMRGSKTHGWGAKKKHRGGGSRGGRGASGYKKHKKSLMIKLYPGGYFGKTGFKIPQKVIRLTATKAINLKDLDIIARKTGKKEINVAELGYDKVLSTGKLTQALTIEAPSFAAKAKEKITSSGGKFVESGASEAE
jgi:large subunit ribosomal protein L15